jgi:hypothetical protein
MKNNDAITVGRGMAGAAIGGVLGWFAFAWLVSQGFYALILPGALVGVVCGLLSGGASLVSAILCTVIAVVLMLVLEWKHMPFIADDSFGYFLTHLHELRGLTWLMLVFGAVCAFWFGRGRKQASAATTS